MKSWHERLKYALQKRGKTYGDLAEATGLRLTSVYAWNPNATKRTRMMNGDNAAIVCNYLQISPLWLFTGRKPSGLFSNIDETFTPTVDEITIIQALRSLPPDEAKLITKIVSLMAKQA